MGATRELFPRRNVVAGMASGLVISLTALISGLSPAAASPNTKADPSAPTTTVIEAPEPPAPKSQAPKSDDGGRDAQWPTAAPQSEPKAAPLPDVVPTQAPVVQPKPAATPSAAPTVEVQAPPAPQTTATPTTKAPQAATTTPAPPTTHTTTTKVAEPTTAAPTSTPKPVATEAPAEPSPQPRSNTEDRPVDRVPETPAMEPSAPAEAPATPITPAVPSTPTAEVSATPTVTGAPSATATSSTATEAARPIETVRPQTLDAPAADVELARNAKPIEQKPDPAPQQDIAALAVSLNVSHRVDDRDRDWDRPDFQLRGDRETTTRDRGGLDWDRKVRQWRPEWVQYDEYYRPIIFNPYRDPVRVVYVYQNSPRIVTINPLQRVVLYAAELAAYSFTAVVVNALNTAVNVAVGSFFGGGFIPAVGVPLPPPPPPVWRYDNVPVQVRYSRAVYEPFRVQRIVDVGDDARYGERKVLLDGVTPAWGVWTQTAAGERQFEVHRTQQFPGLDEPREAPLPGDYRMQLVSGNTTDTSNGLDRNQVYLIAAAVACSVLSLGAVGMVVLMGRRRGM